MNTKTILISVFCVLFGVFTWFVYLIYFAAPWGGGAAPPHPARAQATRVKIACVKYEMDYGKWPPNLESLLIDDGRQGPYLLRESTPVDANGQILDVFHNQYRYRAPEDGEGVLLLSAGENGIFGDDDDYQPEIFD